MSADDDAGDPGASPRFVLPGLALGGLRCLSSLRRHGFTHVLSVINLPVAIPEKDDDEEEKRDEGEATTAPAAGAAATGTAAAARSSAAAAIRHARIDLADDEGADLLSHLPFATAWVTEALMTENGGEPAEGTAAAATAADAAADDDDDKSKSKSNKVLIHCSAGVSRSAAVAAACMMALNRASSSSSSSSSLASSSSSPSPPPLSADAAVAAVAAAAPGTAPNRGFQRQLRLFEEMGCRLDARSSAEYRAWRARAMAAAAAGGGGGGGGSGGGRRAAAEQDAAATASSAKDRPPRSPPRSPPLLTTYRCRACRRLVATSDNAVPATSETGGGPQKMFAGKSWNKAKIGTSLAGGKKAAAASNEEKEEEEEEEEKEKEAPPLPLGSDGSSLFVEPLKWMLDALSLESGGGGGRKGNGGSGSGDGGDGAGDEAGEASKTPPPTKGKLHCPGCSSRLGSFSWAGSQSATGAWVVPAFQLHLCRLDAAEEEEEGEEEEREGKEEEDAKRKGAAAAPSPAPSPSPAHSSPAVPPSVASRIRQPRFLK